MSLGDIFLHYDEKCCSLPESHIHRPINVQTVQSVRLPPEILPDAFFLCLSNGGWKVQHQAVLGNHGNKMIFFLGGGISVWVMHMLNADCLLWSFNEMVRQWQVSPALLSNRPLKVWHTQCTLTVILSHLNQLICLVGNPLMCTQSLFNPKYKYIYI